MRYTFPRISLKFAILLEPVRFKLHKSRSKTAPTVDFLSILTARKRPRGPVKRALIYILLAQGIGFWELYLAKQLFLQKPPLHHGYTQSAESEKSKTA